MTDKLHDLTGKTAVITGGAGLLGPRHAIALAQLGANVIVTDLSDAQAQATAESVRKQTGNGHVEGIAMDVTDPASIERLDARLAADGRAATILVNNAAIDPKVDDSGPINSSRLEAFSIDDWNHQINVGLTGAVSCARVFGGRMANGSGGVILNIASDLSVIAPDQRLYRKDGVAEEQQPVKPVSYSVIKSGLVGLTRYLATYWADRNVRVNALSPGGVFNNQPDDFVARLADRIPMGRMAKVDEYMGAVQFLCTDASSYMTGQNLVIDGGRSVL